MHLLLPRLSPALLAVLIIVGGCGSRPVQRQQAFAPNTPFSKKIPVAGDIACWAVKRAFLSQGYMLDRSADAQIMTGTKDAQPDEDTNVTLRLQTTCVDNRDGTSTVFVSANQEVSKLQSVKQSVTAGVSIATVTVPAGSERVMRVINRQTIQDPAFYQSFYSLVQTLAAEEQRNTALEAARGGSRPDTRDSRRD
jgi:hypothetical protein